MIQMNMKVRVESAIWQIFYESLIYLNLFHVTNSFQNIKSTNLIKQILTASNEIFPVEKYSIQDKIPKKLFYCLV